MKTKLKWHERMLGWFIYSGRILPPRAYVVTVAWMIFFVIVAVAMMFGFILYWSGR